MSVVVYSCCSDPVKVTMTGSQELKFVSQQNDVFSFQDTIKGESFVISLPLVLELASHNFHNPLMNSAYALSCPEEPQNTMDERTFSLRCDQAISYDGEVIIADSDLSNNPDIEITIFEQDLTISFTDEFMSKSVFNLNEHTFTIDLLTSDGLDIGNSGTIMFR